MVRPLAPRTARQSRLEARALFERAIALDPRDAYALFAAALTYANQIHGGTSLDPEGDLRTASSLAERAHAIDSNNSGCQAALGAIRRLQRRHPEALFHYERAVALNPVTHPSRANAGFTNLLLGRARRRRNRSSARWPRPPKPVPSSASGTSTPG